MAKIPVDYQALRDAAAQKRPQLAPGLAPKYTGSGLGSSALNDQLKRISSAPPKTSKANTQGSKLAKAAAKKIMDSPTASDEQKRQAYDILNPKNPSGLASVFGGGAGLLAKGGMKLLSAFDSGRAAIVSAASEGNDLLTDVFNLKGHEYVDASWGELAQQARDHVGFGSVFREKAAASAAAGKNSVFGIKVFEDPNVLKNAPKGSKAFKQFLKEGTRATAADVSAGKAKKVGDNMLDYTTGGKMLGIGVGLVGDIGLDPLTYLTMGGSKMAGMSAEAVAKKATAAVEAKIAKGLAADVEERIVQKVLTKGKWSLNSKELDLIGMAGEGGIHFRVPGTGMLGRNTVGVLAKNKRVAAGVAEGVAAGLTEEAALGAAKAAAKHGVRTGAVRGTENLMKYTPVGGYTAMRAKTRGVIAGLDKAAALGGKYADLKNMIHTGTAKDAVRGFNVILGERAAGAAQENFRNELNKAFVALNERTKQLGIDPNDIHHMLGDPDGIARITRGEFEYLNADGVMVDAGTNETRRIAKHPSEKGVALIEDWDEFAHKTLPALFNERAGRDIINMGQLREGWQFSVRPMDTYDYLQREFGRKVVEGGNAGYPLGAAAFETPAHIVPGNTFLGEMLYKTEESVGKFPSIKGVPNADQMTPGQQAMHILERHELTLGVDDVKAMFETDISKSVPAQINSMSQRVYTAQFESELIRRGVATSLTRRVVDESVTEGGDAVIQLKLNRAQRRLQARMVEYQADSAKSSIEKLTQRVRVLRNLAASRDARRVPALANMTKPARAAMEAEHAAMEAVVARMEPLEQHVSAFRAMVTEIMAGFDNAGYINTPEYEHLVAKMEAAAEAIDKSHGAMGVVIRQREELAYAMAQADEAAQRGKPLLGQAATRDQMAERIDDLEVVIVGVHGAIVANLTETHAVLAPQLEKMDKILGDVAQAQVLRKDLAAAQKAGDAATVSVIESQLRNNFWTDLSGHSATELKAIGVRTRRISQPLRDQVKTINATRGELDGLAAERENLAKQLERAAAGGDPEAVLKLINSFPHKEGVALVNPLNDDGLWFLRQTPSNATEGSLGVELHQANPFGNDPGVVAKLTNSKVYGQDIIPMSSGGRFDSYGTYAEHGERVMRNEMFQQAWENGTLTWQSMPTHKDQWKIVQRALKDGSTFEASLVKAFGDLKNNIGLKRRAYKNPNVSDGEWLHSQLADRFLGTGGKGPAELKSKVADDFRQRLARTYDSIIIGGYDGEPWKVIVLNHDAVETVGGQKLQGLANLQKYEAAVQHQAFRYEEILNKVYDDAGINLDLLSANHDDLKRVFIDNTASKDALERQLSVAASVTVDDYLGFEYQLRGEVERLADAASVHRASAEASRAEIAGLEDALAVVKAKETAEIEDILGQLAEYKASSKALEADLIKRRREVKRSQSALDKHMGNLEKTIKRNIADTGDGGTKVVTDSWSDLNDHLQRSMRLLSKDTYAPNAIVDAIVGMREIVGSPKGVEGLLRNVDKITAVWRSQAMLRPGFHVRNFLGGAINNTIAHVEVSSYAAFNKPYRVYRKAAATAAHGDAVKAVRVAFGNQAADFIDQIVTGGVVNGGQAAAEGSLLRSASGNLNPLSTKFKLYQANGRATANVENNLRGAMAWDRLVKGADMDEVLADVARYHFDYDDLSALERDWIKRIVPFYTWTRKNLPLQIEMMLENPKVMLRYVNAKKDIEEVTNDDDMRPNWLNSTMPIRLPFFQGKSESAAFLSVDAPFKDIGGPLRPGKALESVNPFIKTPVEMTLGRKVFGGIPFKEGYQPVPSVWEGLGIPDVMQKFGRASKDADGNWVMRDKDLYLVEQWLPILGQARKLIPNVRDSVNPKTGVKNVDKYEDRVVFSWASAVFGQPIRTVTATDQNNEMVRRSVELKKLTTDLQTKGYMASGTKKQQLQAQQAK